MNNLIYCTRCKPGKPFMSGRALMTHMDEKHPPLEKDEQRMVVDVYKKAGCEVYDLSQGFRPEKCPHCHKPLSKGRRGRHGTTRQTPGLSDLYIMPPIGTPNARNYLPWWHETKRRHVGKQSNDQIVFQERNEARGLEVVVGGQAEAIAQLERRGLVHRWH